MQRVAFAILLGVTVMLSAVSASAFELLRVGSTCGNSQHLFWHLPMVDVDASRLSVDYQGLVAEAIQRWNDAGTGFHFGTGSGQFCNIDDAVTSLGFSVNDCSNSALADALAVTRLRWDERSGELLDADTVYNSNAGLLRDHDIFRQVAMHELGHVMGLDHSDACGGSGTGTLMQAFLSASAPRILRPTADDIAGAKAIYAPVSGSPPPPGANSCAIQRSPSRWSFLWVVAPALLMALHRAWRVRAAR